MSEYMVDAQNLKKFYKETDQIWALNGITMQVKRGEMVAITGPSGSGKSTVLNLIGSLDKQSEGRIFISGVDLQSLKGNALADFRRKNIGFVFQLFHLVPVINAQENVMLPLLPYRSKLSFNLEARARDLLELVGLGKRLHHFPGELSGGECQRVAIARALINHPGLVLADEPTGNLDTKSGHDVLHLLKNLNIKFGTTIVLVTHDQSIASRFDRVLTLTDGVFL